jgi:hypothetical protein
VRIVNNHIALGTDRVTDFRKPLSLKLSHEIMKQAKRAKYAKSSSTYFQLLTCFQYVTELVRGTSPT